MNRYFKEKLRREDVLHTFSGVRPLFDDGKGNPSAVTRDYVFDLDETGGAPLLNVFGGKITTFRELAERGMHRLKDVFPTMGRDWTGDGAAARRRHAGRRLRAASSRACARAYPWMPRALAAPLRRGSTARGPSGIVGGATSLDGLGRHFGGAALRGRGALSRGATNGRRRPRTCCCRRTKHDLHMTDAEQRRLRRLVRRRAAAARTAA